ncbi:MAG: DUF2975 domain-containing protein [Pseudomonadota bacterium]
MTRLFARFVSFGCLLAFLVSVGLLLFYAIDINAFADLARQNLALAIDWKTVVAAQWYSLWILSAVYLAIGLVGLFFLHRAFTKFARGEFFNESNSRDLRLFAVLLFVQALAKPIHYSLASVLLSLNHLPGQRLLSISFGSFELKVIVLAMVLWVISDMLVRGRELEHENQQFV